MEELKTSDFYYDLPPELIAQDPLEDRSSSRLMVLDKETGEVSHHVFREIGNYLEPGDCLVLNNTKVIPVSYTHLMYLTSTALIKEFCGFPKLGTAHDGIINQQHAAALNQITDRNKLHFGDQIPLALDSGHKGTGPCRRIFNKRAGKRNP